MNAAALSKHRRLAVLFASSVAAVSAHVNAQTPSPGDRYVIVHETNSAERGSRNTSSSSHDQDTYSVRIIDARGDGFELEYDLPAETSAEDRARSWQFPVRIFQPNNGPLQLLNGAELDVRITRWLAAGKLPRSACGHWIFTWNAFKVECDPQSVIGFLDELRLPLVPVVAGENYTVNNPAASGVLQAEKGGFTTSAALDPTAMQRKAAENDVILGEIMRKPVALNDALLARTQDHISGTVAFRLDVDGDGVVTRRTSIYQIETRKADGEIVARTIDDRLERTLLPGTR